MTIRKLTATGMGIAALALVPSAAGADPGNGTNAGTLAFTCDGQPLTFLVENRGVFGTAKVLETGDTFIATSFTLNGTVLSSKQGPASREPITCTNAGPNGNLVVTGYFVPTTN